jgi:hypothetical protein
MPLRIASAARHRSDRQHEPNLTLFEIPLQEAFRTSAFSSQWYP